MTATRKRHLLAALEGQLHRWARGSNARLACKRVSMLMKTIQHQAKHAVDAGFPRRIAALVSEAATIEDRQVRESYLLLARMDCLLWQIALGHCTETVDLSPSAPQRSVA